MIASFLDTDKYKLTIGQFVRSCFYNFEVEYRLFIRNPEIIFPENFDVLLKEEIQKLSDVKISREEVEWLRTSQDGVFSDDYLAFLANYRYNPKQVYVKQKNGKLDLRIKGFWKDAIYWEVPLLAIISELYNKQYKSKFSSLYSLMEKGTELYSNVYKYGIKCYDFGTRRRFSFEYQDKILERFLASPTYPYLKGTSNLYFAKKYAKLAIGTMAHEGPMAMQTLWSMDESVWMKKWIDYYQGKLAIALPDTLTTKHCLKHVFNDWKLLKLYDGFRQDSGVVYDFIELILDHYRKYGVNTKSKTILLSDRLTPERLENYYNAYKDQINIEGAIGTWLTNGISNFDPVIKLTHVKTSENDKYYPVVKLSDSPEKAICTDKKHLKEIQHAANS